MRRVSCAVIEKLYVRHDMLIHRADALYREPPVPAGVLPARVQGTDSPALPLAEAAMKLADEKLAQEQQTEFIVDVNEGNTRSLRGIASAGFQLIAKSVYVTWFQQWYWESDRTRLDPRASSLFQTCWPKPVEAALRIDSESAL